METTVGISKRPHTLCSSADEMETELGTELQCDLKGTEIKDQNRSRTQNPQAPWSAEETLGKWNFFPRKVGFRLCACLAL